MTLVRNAAFRWFWSGQVISLLGDHLYPMVVVALTVPTSERPALTLGVTMAARFLALALFIVLGGVLADRLPRFRLLALTDVLRALALVPLVLLGGESPLWLVVVVSFVMGAGEALYGPTYDASISSIVDRELLAKANAASKVVRSLAKVIGPGAAAVLVSLLGVRGALALDIATFAVSLGTLGMLVLRGHSGGTPAPRQEGSTLVREALDGFSVLLKMRWLATLEVMAVVHVLLAVAPWLVLLPIITERGTGSVGTYGWLLGAFSAGGLPGALAASRLRLKRPGVALLLGLIPFGIACLALGLTSSVLVLLPLFFAAGFGTEFTDVFKMTAIQKQVAPEYLGRIFALDFLASFVTMPLGQLLTGLLVLPGQERPMMLWAGGIILTTTLLPLLVPGVATLGKAAASQATPKEGAESELPSTGMAS
ncbi:MFS transporter [Archangium sp.]|uniref:MFS transporter n=1 Tax=Archangium sp. TaxID=1872627 RepID=UPI00286A0BF0|nr:MFS transporter [Archangium sp.]